MSKQRQRPNVKEILRDREKNHIKWFSNKIKNDKDFLEWIEKCVKAIKERNEKRKISSL